MRAFVVSVLWGVVSLFSAEACAQGMFLESGTGGLYLIGGATLNGGLCGVGGSIGYSFWGRLDLGFSAAKSFYEEKSNSGRFAWSWMGETPTVAPSEITKALSSLSLTPSCAVYLMRQGERIPFTHGRHVPCSAVLSGSYKRTLYSGDYTRTNGGMGSSEYSVGAVLYRAFWRAPDHSLIPEVGLTYTHAQMHRCFTEYRYGELVRQSRSVTEQVISECLLLTIGIHSTVTFASGNIWHIGVQGGFTNRRRIYSISMGYIFTNLASRMTGTP